MKIVIHDNKRNMSKIEGLLIVTSDATYLNATVDDRGYAYSFHGSVWPNELPEVFYPRPNLKYGTVPKVRDEIMEHFKHSVNSVEIWRER